MEAKVVEMINIVLVDDHHLVRQGLRALLENEPGFKVVGESSSGLEAVKQVQQLHPEILVVDLMLGDMNGLEVTRQVVETCPKTMVVVLSMYGTEAYVHEALRAGARAYVLKESTSNELVRAVREAAAGHRYLSPPLSERAIEAYMRKTESDRDRLDPYDTLTTREREVLNLAAQSYTNAEIAEKLYISRRTVEVHRAHMIQKLNLESQTDLIRYALQKGILPPGKEPKGMQKSELSGKESHK